MESAESVRMQERVSKSPRTCTCVLEKRSFESVEELMQTIQAAQSEMLHEMAAVLCMRRQKEEEREERKNRQQGGRLCQQRSRPWWEQVAAS